MKESLIAIRDHCEWCIAVRDFKTDGSVRPDCGKCSCTLYHHRFGIVDEGQVVPPMDAIRGHCLKCLSGDEEEVRNCIAGPDFAELGDASEGFEPCHLWPWRFGEEPRTTSPEQSHEGQKKKSEQAA